jgi:hypothetical protein
MAATELRSGSLRCGKCGGDVEVMVGDYIFGVGFDCPTCGEEK